MQSRMEGSRSRRKIPTRYTDLIIKGVGISLGGYIKMTADRTNISSKGIATHNITILGASKQLRRRPVYIQILITQLKSL